MKNLFNTVKMDSPRYNRFDLSHDVKMSCNMGQLIPTMVLDCVPGDKVNLGCESLVRFAPMVAPPMHRIDVTNHYWFVPYRLLWENFEKWWTNTKIGSPAALPAFPVFALKADGSNYTKLLDHLGLPDPGQNTGAVNDVVVSAMFPAAYQRVWHEFYRDQNLQVEDPVVLVDGDNSATLHLLEIRNRCWEHDYFTASLPFAQKGDSVDVPLGDVVLKEPTNWIGDGTPMFRDTIGGPAVGDVSAVNMGGGVGQVEASGSPGNPIAYDPDHTLGVDAGTINDLRLAMRVQRWLEKMARGGSRFIESILVRFGVRSSDARLQRPEYITGSKTPVRISEVLQTGETATTPQGNMAGHGISAIEYKGGFYSVEEPGCIICMMSVMPKTGYFQGVDKMWLKVNDPTEWYDPEFAHLGEQEVTRDEIFAFTAGGGETFGYVPRFAEHKFMNNRVAGQFRSTLDFWHLAREFGAFPVLNEAFVRCDDTSLHRIFAVTDPGEDKLWCHVYHKVNAKRPMPKFGTPTF